MKTTECIMDAAAHLLKPHEFIKYLPLLARGSRFDIVVYCTEFETTAVLTKSEYLTYSPDLYYVASIQFYEKTTITEVSALSSLYLSRLMSLYYYGSILPQRLDAMPCLIFL